MRSQFIKFGCLFPTMGTKNHSDNHTQPKFNLTEKNANAKSVIKKDLYQ